MTTHTIANLLYVSPERDLLYVTDTDTTDFVPSHRFEHLSCFFRKITSYLLPTFLHSAVAGLLALGAHTLNFSDISLAPLAQYLPERFRATYTILSNYSLRDVHMWAAEGLAQTCWLLYADARTGLAPDEVQFRTSAADHTSHANVSGNDNSWLAALELWRAAGSHDAPPGVRDVQPVAYTDKGRDYDVKKAEYLLRPEVSSPLISSHVSGLSTVPRPSSPSTSSGARRATLNGASAAGPSSRPSKRTAARGAGTPLYATWTRALCGG